MSQSIADPISKSKLPVSRPTNASTPPERDAVPMSEIEAAIRSIRHGVVQIIIQDGVVIQIDRTEKVRLR